MALHGAARKSPPLLSRLVGLRLLKIQQNQCYRRKSDAEPVHPA